MSGISIFYHIINKDLFVPDTFRDKSEYWCLSGMGEKIPNFRKMAKLVRIGGY